MKPSDLSITGVLGLQIRTVELFWKRLKPRIYGFSAIGGMEKLVERFRKYVCIIIIAVWSSLSYLTLRLMQIFYKYFCSQV